MHILFDNSFIIAISSHILLMIGGFKSVHFQSLTQDSRDISHERNVKEKPVFDMSLMLVSKIEASGGSQNCSSESSFATVQFPHDSSSRIVIYNRKCDCIKYLKLRDVCKDCGDVSA